MPKKAHVKAVREALAKKLSVGDRHIYKLAQPLANDAQASAEDGVYLLAAKERINLNKYLPEGKVSEIRELHLKLNQQQALGSYQESTRKKAQTTPRFSKMTCIGKGFTLTDPILPARILIEAKKMSETVYPLLYVLENSIREVIVRVMSNKYGNNWWDVEVHKDIKDEVQRRKRQEKENPWHGKRGAHEIYYTDILHLKRIVQKNWSDFKDILPGQQWLTQRLEEISHSRNPVAHMNPLSQKDIKRIEVYFRDWHDQIKAKTSAIPKVYNQ